MKRKILPFLQYTGETTTDQAAASTYFVLEGGLFAYPSGRQVSTSVGVAIANFDVNAARGDITTTFTESAVISWTDGNFTNGAAVFCMLPSGVVQTVFLGQPPANCVPISLRPMTVGSDSLLSSQTPASTETASSIRLSSSTPSTTAADTAPASIKNSPSVASPTLINNQETSLGSKPSSLLVPMVTAKIETASGIVDTLPDLISGSIEQPISKPSSTTMFIDTSDLVSTTRYGGREFVHIIPVAILGIVGHNATCDCMQTSYHFSVLMSLPVSWSTMTTPNYERHCDCMRTFTYFATSTSSLPLAPTPITVTATATFFEQVCACMTSSMYTITTYPTVALDVPSSLTALTTTETLAPAELASARVTSQVLSTVIGSPTARRTYDGSLSGSSEMAAYSSSSRTVTTASAQVGTKVESSTVASLESVDAPESLSLDAEVPISSDLGAPTGLTATTAGAPRAASLDDISQTDGADVPSVGAFGRSTIIGSSGVDIATYVGSKASSISGSPSINASGGPKPHVSGSATASRATTFSSVIRIGRNASTSGTRFHRNDSSEHHAASRSNYASSHYGGGPHTPPDSSSVSSAPAVGSGLAPVYSDGHPSAIGKVGSRVITSSDAPNAVVPATSATDGLSRARIDASSRSDAAMLGGSTEWPASAMVSSAEVAIKLKQPVSSVLLYFLLHLLAMLV